MKKFFKLALVSFAMLTSLAGCGSTAEEKLPDIVTNFKLDGQTGEFSFTGVEEAKTYYVRVYNHTETKEVTKEDGTTETVELTLDEKMPVAARRIRFKSDVTEYSGELDISEFNPGGSYDAYVYTYIKNDDGDLIYSHTDASNFTYKGTYSTPVITVSNVNAELADAAVKLTFTNDFFTDEYLDKAPNYLITSYNGENKVNTYTVKSTDIVEVETESTDSSGNVTKTTGHEATLTMSDVTALEGNYITVQIISNDSVAYFDSAVSDKAELKDLVKTEETPGGEDQGGGSSF